LVVELDRVRGFPAHRLSLDPCPHGRRAVPVSGFAARRGIFVAYNCASLWHELAVERNSLSPFYRWLWWFNGSLRLSVHMPYEARFFKTIGLRIWGSGVRIFPGAPIKSST